MWEKYCKKSSLSQIIPYHAALWNNNNILQFHDAGSNQARSLASDGATKVNSVSIDWFVNNFSIPKVDLIKCDIEGAEMQAIEGAKNTISMFHPKLCISIYHKSNDLWDILFFIDSICKQYTYYIAHHNFYHTETVLYAYYSSDENSHCHYAK
jgi:hypothetical protein